MRTSLLIPLSLVAHAGVFVAISHKSKEIEKRQTLIAVVEKKKEEEKKKEPPKPVEAPKEMLQKTRPILDKAPPPPEAAKPSAAMEALPDVGMMGGGGPAGVAGGTGPAVGGGGGKGPAGPREKTLGAPAGAAAAKDPDLAAEIAAWKPRPTTRIKPVYPDEARGAEIEGTVTVAVRIDCTGKVIDAQIVKGLGHGLDEAALTAVKKTEFEPAPRCAKGFEKTVKINYAFRLGD